MMKDTKMGDNFPMRTITLRGVRMVGIQREDPTKRMSDAEFQVGRDKGLCYRHDELNYAGHRCKIKEQRELEFWW